MTKRILIADDEQAVRELLELVLQDSGYEVQSARNGDELVRMAQENVPDLAIVDLMMPIMDGFEAIRQLRNDTRTAHIPTIILTARASPTDLVTGFESGADDYITKPFNTDELLARIKGQLRRAAQLPVSSPLTGLPGNVLITEEIKRRLARGDSFALCHVDLNNFKAFNDTYGFARGDRMIKLVAETLVRAVAEHGSGSDFLGHIGGDDFALLTRPEYVDAICGALISSFDQSARALYDPQDLTRGYLQAFDRQGVSRRFPIISIAIGIATTRVRAFADHEEISRVAADMKHFAKQQPGSSFAVDVRSAEEREIVRERRGQRLPTVALITPNPALSEQLRAALEAAGYRALEAPGIPEANALLAHTPDLSLITADAALGEALWELMAASRVDRPDVPLVVCSTHPGDAAIASAHGAEAFLQLPVVAEQFLACVADCLRREE